MAANAEKLFWKAYASAVRKAATLPDADAPVFIASHATVAVPAGDNVVPVAVTNDGIYNVSDALLKPDSLFYAPARSNSYIQRVSQYLGNVDVGADADDILKKRLADARGQEASAAIGLANVKDKAYVQFEKEKAKFGEKREFKEWVVASYPPFLAADQALKGASGKVYSLLSQVNGPKAAVLINDLQKIAKAMNDQQSSPGFNMACSAEDMNTLNAYAKAQAEQSGAGLPVPTATLLRPTYTIQDYTATLDGWFNKTFDEKDKKRADIELSAGENTSNETLGWKKLSGEGTLSNWNIPLINIGANASTSTNTSALDISGSEKEIKFALTYNDIKVLTINPGAWNPGAVGSTTYTQLKKTEPITLVRPSQLILATGVGLEVEFSGEVKKKFEQSIETQTQASGSASFRVFGVGIGIGASYESKDTSITHAGSYDKGSGKLVAKPSTFVSNCTLLGVVGEIVAF